MKFEIIHDSNKRIPVNPEKYLWQHCDELFLISRMAREELFLKGQSTGIVFTMTRVSDMKLVESWMSFNALEVWLIDGGFVPVDGSATLHSGTKGRKI